MSSRRVTHSVHVVALCARGCDGCMDSQGVLNIMIPVVIGGRQALINSFALYPPCTPRAGSEDGLHVVSHCEQFVDTSSNSTRRRRQDLNDPARMAIKEDPPSTTIVGDLPSRTDRLCRHPPHIRGQMPRPPYSPLDRQHGSLFRHGKRLLLKQGDATNEQSLSPNTCCPAT